MDIHSHVNQKRKGSERPKHAPHKYLHEPLCCERDAKSEIYFEIMSTLYSIIYSGFYGGLGVHGRTKLECTLKK